MVKSSRLLKTIYKYLLCLKSNVLQCNFMYIAEERLGRGNHLTPSNYLSTVAQNALHSMYAAKIAPSPYSAPACCSLIALYVHVYEERVARFLSICAKSQLVPTTGTQH